MRAGSLAAAVAAAVLLTACGGQRDEQGGQATTSTSTQTSEPVAPSPSSTPDPRGLDVSLERVTVVENPVNMTSADGVLYVVEQGGRVRAIRNGQLEAGAVLDVSDEVRAGGERGLLGLAFSNDGRHLYVNLTDRSGDTRIVEYAFDGQRADESTRRELLRVDQPFANHNGGHIVMDSDGVLWIGMGDGGSAGDPQNNAQNPRSLLGKMLKLDPRDDDPEPVIWAIGLRNPWRFFLDEEAGELWVADVGQNSIEEVNRAPLDASGLNYGWPFREGKQKFRDEDAPDDLVDPVIEYANGNGNCAVTGGEIYRGDAIPALRGAYLFGDYCKGQVRALFPSGDELRDLAVTVDGLTSFGSDDEGEIYVLSAGDGGVYRIVPG